MQNCGLIANSGFFWIHVSIHVCMYICVRQCSPSTKTVFVSNPRYWLYAAVSSKCLLVTNDEMRDHLFNLLGNSFFPRWKEKHQVLVTNAEQLYLLIS